MPAAGKPSQLVSTLPKSIMDNHGDSSIASPMPKANNGRVFNVGVGRLQKQEINDD